MKKTGLMGNTNFYKGPGKVTKYDLAVHTQIIKAGYSACFKGDISLTGAGLSPYA